ncbi:MAG: hypothetical protein L6243_01605 [Candidatus Altiarchaeales archaeon]|nr:hypothetical protein [Candidatus Altiarchaeota archaeon]MCG2782266.1 hypothetical protein [Candidatus Altiarchaeales archaeon]MBU4266527.1 hypothetical protein [Candidatus Altiarchaeota archaeon]MBU4342145.1 hypothetical protein [Candidatus Altiarchaeota archaeon]MBU4406963.1 hypothetical protein [Candidatus Altiarchaeota archaeon]
MPKASGLKIGRVVSEIGNEVVASFPDSDVPRDLGSASHLYGKRISLGSRKGRIFDVIGRVDSPYLVIKSGKK